MTFSVLSSATRSASDVLGFILTHLHPYRWYSLDAAVVCTVIWASLRLIPTPRERAHVTRLRGPPNESFLYGVGERIFDDDGSGATYEAWAQEYGPVYTVPMALWKKMIVLCDPKAIAHFYAMESWTYIQTPFNKKALAIIFGKGIFWSHGEDHKRQRRYLTPAFSVAILRQITPIFYDSAYKAKSAWDALIQSSGGESAVIEVQSWMNHISLDTIGLAGFSHNFGTLEGKRAYLAEIFDALSESPPPTVLNKILFMVAQTFPFVIQLSTSRDRVIQKLHDAMEAISNGLLARIQKELEMGIVEGKEGKSLIGSLIKGADGTSEFHSTKKIVAQVTALVLAGYETTSISLTWALFELSRNPDVQTRLRDVLLEHGADPTYDELTNGLPYLDAVVHEILRVHPPVQDTLRIAVEDDVVPLSEPIRLASGEMVDSLTIDKGTLVSVSIECMNRSTAFWGEDAKVFRPSRWLEDDHGQSGIPATAKTIQGHRHLLTFADGPRMCLGKNFVLTELKAVLAVLIKNFVFELRDGVDSKVEIRRGMLPRPNIVGEVGCKLPLRVQPYAA